MEQGNKSTILGVYGVLPEVAVLFNPGKWGLPIRLLFLFFTMPGVGEFEVAFSLIAPDGSEMPFGSSSLAKLDEKSPSTVIGFGVLGAVFQSEGNYFVRILANGKQVYLESFRVGILPESP